MRPARRCRFREGRRDGGDEAGRRVTGGDQAEGGVAGPGRVESWIDNARHLAAHTLAFRRYVRWGAERGDGSS